MPFNSLTARISVVILIIRLQFRRHSLREKQATHRPSTNHILFLSSTFSFCLNKEETWSLNWNYLLSQLHVLTPHHSSRATNRNVNTTFEHKMTQDRGYVHKFLSNPRSRHLQLRRRYFSAEKRWASMTMHPIS